MNMEVCLIVILKAIIKKKKINYKLFEESFLKWSREKKVLFIELNKAHWHKAVEAKRHSGLH